MDPKWLEWAKQLQSIAQAGLTYSKDMYDLERFQQIRDISMEIMSEYTKTDMNTIQALFANETGYATPKVDVRAVIFKDDRILMVKEKIDGKWALPGGWADIGLSPTEVAVKEAREETGFDVRAVRLLAVHDKKCHPHPPSPYHVYKLFIQCEIVGGEATGGAETSEVRFYDINDLPELSIERNTESQIQTIFRLRNTIGPAECD
ncbi:NUDIX hydrolase [Paenibacillus chartarius]|uniref:NUDIX hydrolase n=1 Tax=Paenibacillus chartarius TaxID=747481 RepID=A0ABV6DE59_9BACL